MGSTIVVVAHHDEAVRAALIERLDREEGLVVAAAAAVVEPDAWPGAVVVAGGRSLDDLTTSQPVVALVGAEPLATARRALAMGARDLLSWPDEAARLGQAVRAAADRRRSETGGNPGRVVAVAATRGGLGASTLSAWVARALSAERLVELDPSASMAVWCPDGVGDLLLVAARPTAQTLAEAAMPSSFGVPVIGLLGHSIELDQERALLELFRRDDGITVIDTGTVAGPGYRLWRRADVRVLLVGDDVRSVLASKHQATDADLWCIRKMRRGGVRERDLSAAIGCPATSVIGTKVGVARATDLGRLATVPRGVDALTEHIRIRLSDAESRVPR